MAQGDTYCAQRYRSYDPASGTFMGYDGQRHPCP
jgi:BA14K-like protein